MAIIKRQKKDDVDDDLTSPLPLAQTPLLPPPPPPPPVNMLMMETWVLIPAELSLVQQPAASSPPSEDTDGGQATAVARVWTRVPVAQGRRWSPFQGTVRLGVMPFFPTPTPTAIRRSSSSLSSASSTDSAAVAAAAAAEVRQYLFLLVVT